jgi:3'-5' exoribonuclease
MLRFLKYDRLEITDVSGDKKDTYMGMMNAPAGKGVHHAYPGGLVVHLLEMWNFWTILRPTLVKDHLVNDENVLTGVILHDLHKAWCMFVYQTKDGVVDMNAVAYGTHPVTSLMKNDIRTLFILSKFAVDVDAYQVNCVTNSEGGFAAAPPKFQTTLAKLVYTLDELSSNVTGRTDVGNNVDIRVNGCPATYKLTPEIK